MNIHSLQTIFTSRWFYSLCFIAVFVAILWPRFEFHGQVPSPDRSQTLVVYVKGYGIGDIWRGPFHEWAYNEAYAYLVDDEGKPVGMTFFRNCVFLIGDLYRGGESSPSWSEQTVEMAKFSRINRETGRAKCRI